MPGQTLFDKIWDRHVIADLGDDYALLHISRHLMHDGGGRGLAMIKSAGQTVRNPDLTFATFDHVISTEPGRTHENTPLTGLTGCRSTIDWITFKASTA